MPTVSVIIPVYNGENYILDTIESVVNQSYGDFELVIVDDGSVDNTEEIIKTFDDERIKYYKKQNGGVSTARNHGLDNANGMYISFLDSDDYWDSNFLELMLSEIGSSECVFCGHVEINGEKQIYYKPAIRTAREKIASEFITHGVRIITNSWLIKKRFIENNDFRFDINSSNGEDVEFFYKVLVMASNEIQVLDKCLSSYVLRSNSLTNREQMYSISRTMDFVESIDRCIKWCNTQNVSNRNTLIESLNEKLTTINIEYKKQCDFKILWTIETSII